MKIFYLKVGNSRLTLWGRNRCVHFETKSFRASELRKKVGDGKIVFVSVVPKVTRLIKKEFRRQCQEVVVGDIPVRPAYKKNIGIDRLINGLGGYRLTRKNFVVIDVGTALTVDFFTQSRRHMGGWIAAGPHLNLNALHRYTAKLPRTTMRATSLVLGRSTRESLLVGQRAFLHGMILEVKWVGKKIFDAPFEIFLTGGGARFVSNHLVRRVPDLTLIGLKILSGE
jgi:pantothenate kinase type III